MNPRRWLLIGSLAWTLLLAAPVQAQEPRRVSAKGVYTGEILIPDAAYDWCWDRLWCQQSSHAAIHAGLTVAVDELGGGWIDAGDAWWVSAGFGALREVVIGPIYHAERCGSPWCGEQLGPLDGLVDLAFRVGGAWVGREMVEVLP